MRDTVNLDAVLGVIGTVLVVVTPFVVAGIIGASRAFSRANDRGRG